MNIFLTIAMSAVLAFRQKKNMMPITANIKSLLPVGFFSALALVAQMTAINLALVAYVISVKRASLIFGVLFGHFIFKEKGVKERLIGAIIMVLGVVLIVLT